MMVGDYAMPDWLSVSRETFDALLDFSGLVEKWNPAINLVSKSGLIDLWRRHILDSAQLYRHAPIGFKTWCDIGSGGGFPGLVMAILAKGDNPDARFVLIESDRRKAVFLTQVARTLALSVTVRTERIESVPGQAADVVSARALAAVDVLCGYAARHLGASGVAIFPKGIGVAEELRDAGKNWTFSLRQVPSLTDPSAAVILLQDVQHV